MWQKMGLRGYVNTETTIQESTIKPRMPRQYGKHVQSTFSCVYVIYDNNFILIRNNPKLFLYG